MEHVAEAITMMREEGGKRKEKLLRKLRLAKQREVALAGREEAGQLHLAPRERRIAKDANRRLPKSLGW